jgi:hypothetical protein
VLPVRSWKDRIAAVEDWDWGYSAGRCKRRMRRFAMGVLAEWGLKRRDGLGGKSR